MHRPSWWRHQMETFSALLALRAGNSPVTSEFPAQRPVTWSFDVFFDLRLNKRLSKQSWGWWFEAPSRPIWRHCDVVMLTLLVLKSEYSRKKVNTMSADVLAPYVARTSAVMVLTKSDKHTFPCLSKGGISTTSAISVLRNDRKRQYIFMFHDVISARQGFNFSDRQSSDNSTPGGKQDGAPGHWGDVNGLIIVQLESQI